MSRTVAVLFVRKDSIYKTLEDTDCYDIDRDALTFKGGPAVYHPPCRAWGVLSWRANPLPGEKELAVWAVEQVQRWGGILEHPVGSRLWKHCGLPKAGDKTGRGETIKINQVEWGHKAKKPTLLYGVDVDFSLLKPTTPNAEPTHVVCAMRAKRYGGTAPDLPDISKGKRDITPVDLAVQLVNCVRNS